MSVAGIDLLEPLLKDATENTVVVGNGKTVNGWHVYPSARGGSWVAEKDRVSEGAAQDGHALHLRTANREGIAGAYPTWHRSYYRTHFARPTVYCSFRIDSHDESRGNSLGFKLAYLHQDNLTAYYVMFHVDGRVQVLKEARDSVDAQDVPGIVLETGKWEYWPGVRRHLVVSQDESGNISVVLDGSLVVEANDPNSFQSGQIGLRLDGLDCRVHSLVVKAPRDFVVEPEGMTKQEVLTGLHAYHTAT